MFQGLGRGELRVLMAILAVGVVVTLLGEGSRGQALPPVRPGPGTVALPTGRLVATPVATPAPLATPNSTPLPSPVAVAPTDPPTSPALATATPVPAPGVVREDGRIDLNRATTEDLMRLPGVGEKRAQAIVAYRQENGPFRNVAGLDEVEGFGAASVQRLEPLLWVEGAAPTAAAPVQGTIRINVARVEELETLSGVGPVLAQRIIDHRTLKGPFRGPADLRRVPGVGPALIARNEGRISYE